MLDGFGLTLILFLLDSIDSRPAADPKLTEKAWIAESNRRYQAYLRGDEQAFPAEQVFAELRADER